MIVQDLYQVGVSGMPFETDTPPVIDPNAVLASPVSAKLFQMVGWGNAQVLQGGGIVQHAKFP